MDYSRLLSKEALTELHDKIQRYNNSNIIMLNGKLALIPKDGFTQEQIDEIVWKAKVAEAQTQYAQKTINSLLPEESLQIINNPTPW
jgi:hypothetical protein